MVSDYLVFHGAPSTCAPDSDSGLHPEYRKFGVRRRLTSADASLGRRSVPVEVSLLSSALGMLTQTYGRELMRAGAQKPGALIEAGELVIQGPAERRHHSAARPSSLGQRRT